MAMVEHEYKDREGRRFKVLLPEGVPDTEADKGVRIGPPDLDSLNLPLTVEIRLNHELAARGLFREADIRRRPQDVVGALMAALAVDAGRIRDHYALTAIPGAP